MGRVNAKRGQKGPAATTRGSGSQQSLITKVRATERSRSRVGDSTENLSRGHSKEGRSEDTSANNASASVRGLEQRASQADFQKILVVNSNESPADQSRGQKPEQRTAYFENTGQNSQTDLKDVESMDDYKPKFEPQITFKEGVATPWPSSSILRQSSNHQGSGSLTSPSKSLFQTPSGGVSQKLRLKAAQRNLRYMQNYNSANMTAEDHAILHKKMREEQFEETLQKQLI